MILPTRYYKNTIFHIFYIFSYYVHFMKCYVLEFHIEYVKICSLIIANVKHLHVLYEN